MAEGHGFIYITGGGNYDLSVWNVESISEGFVHLVRSGHNDAYIPLSSISYVSVRLY